MVRTALNRDLHFLQTLLLDMAQAVDEMVRGVIKSFSEKDKKLAGEIIKLDDQIDYYDRMINITVLEILALQQPVAKDLRRVVSAFDISRNLERLADQVVNVAEGILNLSEEKNGLERLCQLDLLPLAKEALFMLEAAINAFVKEDTKSATQVIYHDEIVDKMRTELRKKIEDCLASYPHLQKNALDYLLMIENLERVADLACNISENIIFVVEGRVIKGEKLEEAPQYLKESLEENLTFQLLKKHTKIITECLSLIPNALEAYIKRDKNKLDEIADHINELEKEADKIKTNIRSHLPTGLILPIEKFKLFFYLKEQDALADLAEKLLKLFSLYEIKNIKFFAPGLNNLLNQSLNPLPLLEEIVENTLRYLTSWEEQSREKAKALIREIRHSEYLTENLAFKVKKGLYENPIELMDFIHLSQIIDIIAEISSRMENVADLMRTMLAK